MTMDKRDLIYIGNYSTSPLKKGTEKVYLNHTGEIFSKSIHIPSDKKGISDQMYVFMKKYFGKRSVCSVEKIYPQDLDLLILRVWRKNQKTISVNKLRDIISWRNIIAMNKQVIKERFNKYILKAHHKKMNDDLNLP